MYDAHVGVTFYYDGLGSTRSLTNNAGQITDTYLYSAYGALLDQVGDTENDYRFTGEQFDASQGNYYLRNRYYDPNNGRLTQMDSWMGVNTDPVTLHKYAYANVDPVNVIDPSGNFGLIEAQTTTNIAGMLATMQVDNSFAIFDILGIQDERIEVARNVNKILGIVALGAGGAQLLKFFSKKFAKTCNSFSENTLVSAENGLKPILEIEIGEKVWAYDEITGKKSLQEVVHLIQGEGTKELVDIELVTGEIITATSGHAFYVGDNWLTAGELSVKQDLLNLNGEKFSIISVNKYNKKSKVYNLTVNKDHTYFVSNDKLLTHNAQTVCNLEGLVIGARKPTIVRNPKHSLGGGGRKAREPAGIEPSDSFYAFEKLSVKSAKDGHWYAKSPDGNNIYRYFESNGKVHWSGSTGDKLSPLKAKEIPIEVRRAFGFKSKGK